MEKQDILKIYFYLDKNKVKILTTEYNLDDFNRNDDVFYNLIQDKIKGYDKVEIYINKRGVRWISNDFILDAVAACRSPKKSTEAVIYDNPNKSDEETFSDKNNSRRKILYDY